MKRILCTGAGGPAGINFSMSLKIAPEKMFVVGTEADEHYLQLARTDKKYLTPSAKETSYISTINDIIRKEKIVMATLGILTRWELTPEEKFENFLRELVDYLQAQLAYFKNGYGEIEWTCNQDHHSDDRQPFEMVVNYCISRNLNWREVLDMIDEYTEDYCQCECHLLNDNNIKKLLSDKRN